MLHCVGQLECLSYKSFKTIKECNDNTIALVQCRKSDLISELVPEALVLALLNLAMPLTLILLIKPLALTLKSDLIFDIGPGLLYQSSSSSSQHPLLFLRNYFSDEITLSCTMAVIRKCWFIYMRCEQNLSFELIYRFFICTPLYLWSILFHCKKHQVIQWAKQF